ncbi:fumarate reductase [Erysipelothrix larvae]|uniref:Fumarate reductase n=1 Tax=Erysipelothrix larvae TaxID=1514105 RepID=A0A109UHJ4_9FIRM|nr:flavocytochrome c [Erysipelothrix larvae]AMC94168.1 fumarate reductase [Erysipelothrix larvae]
MKKLMCILAVILFVITGCGKSNTTDKDSDEKSSATSFQGAKLDTLKDAYDVIVIGAGGGGMSAAIAAKEAGADTVIFEKMPVVGGNTSKSSAGMNASETKFQKNEGIEDSNDLFYEETLKGGKNTNDPELLRFFVDNSSSAIDWLDSMGITLSNLTVTGGMSVKRTHRPADGSAVGQYLVKGLLENVESRQVPIFLQAEVTELVKEGNEIVGVKVTFNGTETKTIKAKAVIVATGGFGANADMVTQYNPSLKGFVTTNQKGSTGDGIVMIEKVGGYAIDMEQIQIHPTVEQKTSYLVTEAVRGEGAILVAQDGKRFINELETRDTVSQAIIGLDDHAAYLVFDQGVKDRVKAINTYVEAGFVLESDTLEGLAEKMNVDKESFTTTLESWNQSVASQNDTDFGRKTGMDHDLGTGPYFAIKIAPGVHHTMGGVKMNANTEVLDQSNTPIPGLYAAGELVGGIHGNNRIGGNAVADIIIFGRQSGVKAAEYIKNK